MTPRNRLVLTVALLAAGLAGAVTVAPQAAATALGPGDHGTQLIRLGAAGTGTLVPLDVDRLIPGSTVVQRFQLHLDGAVLSGRPAVVIDAVQDHERGCVHPEVAAGDSTCGAGDSDGELSSQLLAGVTWLPVPAAGCDAVPASTPGTTLRDLNGITLAAAAAVHAADPDTCVVLTLSLPMSADNLVQSDAVSFDLQVGVTEAQHMGDLAAIGGATAGTVESPPAPEAEVAGSTAEGQSTPEAGVDGRTPEGQPAPETEAGGSTAGGVMAPAPGGLAADDPIQLPFTGSGLIVHALLALGLLQLGALALTMARRSRVPSH